MNWKIIIASRIPFPFLTSRPTDGKTSFLPSPFLYSRILPQSSISEFKTYQKFHISIKIKTATWKPTNHLFQLQPFKIFNAFHRSRKFKPDLFFNKRLPHIEDREKVFSNDDVEWNQFLTRKRPALKQNSMLLWTNFPMQFSILPFNSSELTISWGRGKENSRNQISGKKICCRCSFFHFFSRFYIVEATCFVIIITLLTYQFPNLLFYSGIQSRSVTDAQNEPLVVRIEIDSVLFV